MSTVTTVYVTQGSGNTFKSMHVCNAGGFDLSDFTNFSAWIERIGNQPGFLPVDEMLDGEDYEVKFNAA